MDKILAEIDRLTRRSTPRVPVGANVETADAGPARFLLSEHIVALGDRGRLSTSTTPGDLARLFSAIRDRERLVLWLHGGLVSETAARALTLDAGPELQSATGAYPLFLVWRTGPTEVLPATIRYLLTKPKVVVALLRWVLKLLGIDPLHEVRDMLGLESFGPVPSTRDPEPSRPPVVDLDAEDAEQQLRRLMEQDGELMEALEDLRARERLESLGPIDDLLDSGFVSRVAPPSDSLESISVLTAFGMAASALKVAKRVHVRRDTPGWNGWRDTVLEEVVRESGAPHLVGSGAWHVMKQNAAGAYEAGGGGSLLANQLAAWLRQEGKRELHVVAHSAGSYHAGHLLERLSNQVAPSERASVFTSLALLAPACDLEFFHQRFVAHDARVAARRLFVLTEEQEDVEQMIPLLYRGSLLNLVSGLLEPEPGWPILGMERFLASGTDHALAAKERFFEGELVRAPVDAGGKAGYRSTCLKHGGFDDDDATRASLAALIGHLVLEASDLPEVDPSVLDDAEAAHDLASEEVEVGSGTLEAADLPDLEVAWPDDADSIDYGHIGVAPSEEAFELTAAVLERLAMLNHFRLGQSDRVLFGLRGCTLADDTLELTDFGASVSLIETRPDHITRNCILGVWQRSTGLVCAFRGSTVPNRNYLQDYIRGGPRANMLLTGAYRYHVGRHRSMEGAFRLREPRVGTVRIVVLRPAVGANRIVLTNRDSLDGPGPVMDNIHPAFNPRLGVEFHSAGCQTVTGTWASATQTHLGPWAEFRVRAGLSRAISTSDDGKSFDYLLLTGAEARLVAARPESTALERLRFGSRGPVVEELQRRLGLSGGDVDGIFGGGTAIRLAAWQREHLDDRADGICTAEILRRLGER